MLGWIRGIKLEDWRNGNRQGILISCHDLGYEIQMLPRQISELSSTEKIILWVHEIQREDGTNLFGFLEKKERDLFRALISVNGVGSQMGICLLELFRTDELIEAINNKESSRLSAAHGVGKKTAERLIIELRSKLIKDEIALESNPKPQGEDRITEKEKLLKEVGSALKSLGYLDVEIKAAIEAVHEKKYMDLTESPSITEDFDASMKECLKWLSQELS